MIFNYIIDWICHILYILYIHSWFLIGCTVAASSFWKVQSCWFVNLQPCDDGVVRQKLELKDECFSWFHEPFWFHWQGRTVIYAWLFPKLWGYPHSIAQRFIFYLYDVVMLFIQTGLFPSVSQYRPLGNHPTHKCLRQVERQVEKPTVQLGSLKRVLVLMFATFVLCLQVKLI